MTSVYINNDNNEWVSILDIDTDPLNPDPVNTARDALATHWGVGEDLDSQLESVGGIAMQIITIAHDQSEMYARAFTLSGPHECVVRVVVVSSEREIDGRN